MNLESNDRKRWIEKTLEVFSFFIKLCEDYRLTYFIAYGSAIGTIRHHGFIPWDDDIDVIMPRPDYERLVHIFRKEDMGRYELVTATNTPNYYLPFTKLCDKTTTVYEDTSYRCVIGVFIDIFVLDGIINNPDKIEETGRCYEKYWRMFLLANSYYTITDIFNRFDL